MFFQRMRSKVKGIVIVVAITFIGGLLFVGGSSFFGGDEGQVAQATVATVNGHAIGGRDFQQAFISQLQQAQWEMGRVDGRMTEVIKYRTYDSIVSSILLEQEIERRDIQVSRDEINEAVSEIRAQFDSDEQFAQQLQMAGLTERELGTLLERDLQVEKLRTMVTGTIEISDEALARAYEQVKAHHILVRPLGDDEEAWAGAREEAEFVLAELETMEFAAAAEEYSDDFGSATRGGEVGWISRGDTVPEFEDVAFDLEVGERSGLVRSDFGYHIISVTDRRGAEGEEFEAARDNLIRELQIEQEQAIIDEWFEQLRKNADIVIQDRHLAAFESMLDGDFDQAVIHYQAAIEENPSDGYLHASLGDIYGRIDELDKSIAQYEKAVEKVGNDPQLFFALAGKLGQAQREDEAVANYLRASELAPNDFMLQLQANQALLTLGREEEAGVVEKRIEELFARQQELEGMDALPEMDLEELQDLDLENLELDLELLEPVEE